MQSITSDQNSKNNVEISFSLPFLLKLSVICISLQHLNEPSTDGTTHFDLIDNRKDVIESNSFYKFSQNLIVVKEMAIASRLVDNLIPKPLLGGGFSILSSGVVAIVLSTTRAMREACRMDGQ